MENSAYFHLLLVLVAFNIFKQSETVSLRDETKNIFTTIFHKYQERIRPFNGERYIPVEMEVMVKILQVEKFDVSSKELDVIADLRVKWKDGRLYWNPDQIHFVTVNESTVWTPDVIFLDAVAKPEVILKPRFVIVNSDGRVVSYQRVSVRIYCRTNSSENSHTCPVQLGSNFFPDSEIEFNTIDCVLSSDVENDNWNVSLISDFITVTSFGLGEDMMFSGKNRSVAGCNLGLKKIEKYIPTTDARIMDEREEPTKAGTAPNVSIKNGTVPTQNDVLVLFIALLMSQLRKLGS